MTEPIKEPQAAKKKWPPPPTNSGKRGKVQDQKYVFRFMASIQKLWRYFSGGLTDIDSPTSPAWIEALQMSYLVKLFVNEKGGENDKHQ